VRKRSGENDIPLSGRRHQPVTSPGPSGVTGIAPEETIYLFHGFRYGPGVRADLTAWLGDTVG
jgi:hypothetical protein